MPQELGAGLLWRGRAQGASTTLACPVGGCLEAMGRHHFTKRMLLEVGSRVEEDGEMQPQKDRGTRP